MAVMLLISPAHIASIDARVAHASIPGFPVTTRSRLRRAGVDAKAVERRIADGRLHKLWDPVLLIGVEPARVNPDHVLAAAVALVGPDAALDGASALERRGIWDRHDGTVHVTSDRGHQAIRFRVPSQWRTMKRWRRRDRYLWIRFTRSTAHDSVELLDGIDTTLATTALLRAAPSLTPHQLAFIIARGEYEELFTLDEIASAIDRHAGARGMKSLRRAVVLRRRGCAGTKSRSEDRALPQVTGAFGEPCVNVRGIAGIPSHEPDFCWPERRWIVEIDGRHHYNDPVQRQADLDTDALLRSHGWIVVRIPWHRVWKGMRSVMAELHAAFGA